jgi:hypothetical protein
MDAQERPKNAKGKAGKEIGRRIIGTTRRNYEGL